MKEDFEFRFLTGCSEYLRDLHRCNRHTFRSVTQLRLCGVFSVSMLFRTYAVLDLWP